MLSRTPSSGSNLPSLLDDDEHKSPEQKSQLTYFLRYSVSFSIVMTLLLVLSSTQAVGPFVSLIVPT